MTFNELQTEIYTFLASVDNDIQVDEIKSLDSENNNFDFVNLIGTYFSIGTYSDFEVKDSIPLTIYLVSNKNNKIAVRNKADLFINNTNKKVLQHCRIVKQNSFYNSFVDDEGLFNVVLSFYIYKFN